MHVHVGTPCRALVTGHTETRAHSVTATTRQTQNVGMRIEEPKTMEDVKRMRVQPRHGFRCPARMPVSENPEHPHLHNAQCGDYAGHDGTHTLLLPSGAPWFGQR
jgi:hypothetical protein